MKMNPGDLVYSVYQTDVIDNRLIFFDLYISSSNQTLTLRIRASEQYANLV